VVVDQAAGDVGAAESRDNGKAHMLEEFSGWLDRMDAEAQAKGQQRGEDSGSDKDGHVRFCSANDRIAPLVDDPLIIDGTI
jgi:hypothetical protein